MKNQKIRSMKVHEQSGYNYKATPTIILKGQWLKEMGFEIGDYIRVSCEDGKLIITPDAEKAAMAKTEAEFMEKEMKKLQKRFQTEKKQLHAQFVAERSTEYNGKIIVIGSQKGGVGKTTTTLNLAYSLKEMGKKVLTVDFDSQANLTTCYGIEDTGALEYAIGHLMMAQIEEEFPENFEDYIQSREGVDYIPSSIYLSVVDAKLRTEMGAERMLAEVLEPLRSRYDYILIDTCPALGMLTINALAAADEVIITVNPQLLAMMGLQDFLRTVAKIKKRINPKLEVAGILLTMCESRTTLCKVLTEEVTGSFQGKIKVFDTRIPATVKVGESIYYNMPIAQYSKKASAGIAYRKFAKEIIAYED